MASGVQHPEDPGRSALSLRGVPGCGKRVFVLGYGRLFGQHFLHATHREHVTGKFNAHQAETCLIFVDKALYAEIASDAQILKTMTSETTKLLKRKGSIQSKSTTFRGWCSPQTKSTPFKSSMTTVVIRRST